ncbi:MAG TPA: LptF/LptG family permease [Puia sp.]|nr:LptF/LptG family permease [Puia sp.]
MLNRLFKKLDILIIKAFIGPFIATFFITTFVLVLQFMWLYIDDVVGKGLDTFTVLRFLMYTAATMVPLALPLAVLLSSIMTLGNLGETYELVAIKSAGISLLRFLQPLAVVSLFITVIAFFFNNNILPIANLKMQTLKYDIIVTKPAFDIKEGVFFDRIEGFVIKIGKKEKDDSTIRNVVIYEQNNNGQVDNMIVADSGTMVVTPDKQDLIFTLKSGWRYQEKGDRNVSNGTELVRMGFKEYKKVMDLSSFKMNRTDDSTFKNNYQMLTILQLGRTIDSLKKVDQSYITQLDRPYRRMLKFPNYLDTAKLWAAAAGDTAQDTHLYKLAWARDSLHRLWARDRKILDSVEKEQKAAVAAAAAAAAAKKRDKGKSGGTAGAGNGGDSAKRAGGGVAKAGGAATAGGKPDTGGAATAGGKPDTGGTATAGGTPKAGGAASPTPTPVNVPNLTIAGAPVTKDPPQVMLNDLIPDSLRLTTINGAIEVLNTTRNEQAVPLQLFLAQKRNLLQHQMAWHEKITLAVACMVMFLIGAPLGSIIRKGGIGMPLVFAVIFFVIFFLLNNFGKKLANSEVLTPANGLWLATYVLTPMGIFLIYKALHDSQLFNKEFYFRLSRRIRSLIMKGRKKEPASMP